MSSSNVIHQARLVLAFLAAVIIVASPFVAQGAPLDRWERRIVDEKKPWRAVFIKAADVDGDLDAVVGEHNLNNVAASQLHIFENTDGKGGAWTRHAISKGDEHHDSAQLTDIDSDGDLDIISIGWGHPRVVRYVNKAIDR